jgi:hypothetical protein
MAISKAASGERSFIIAAQDEQADNELLHSVKWRWSFGRSEQRGVYEWRCEVYRTLSTPLSPPVVTYAAYWPNSMAQSYAAFVYQCAHKVARMVENWHTYEAGQGR